MTDCINIKVDDIGCTGCVSDMETILLGTEGILSVVVRYSEDIISVEYDSEVIGDGEILDVIRRMGLKPKKP